jgi:hypothetical protein
VSRLLPTFPWLLLLLGLALAGCQSSDESMAPSPADYVLTVDGMT